MEPISLQPKLIILFLWKTKQNRFQTNYPIFMENKTYGNESTKRT